MGGWRKVCWDTLVGEEMGYVITFADKDPRKVANQDMLSFCAVQMKSSTNTLKDFLARILIVVSTICSANQDKELGTSRSHCNRVNTCPAT